MVKAIAFIGYAYDKDYGKIRLQNIVRTRIHTTNANTIYTNITSLMYFRIAQYFICAIFVRTYLLHTFNVLFFIEDATWKYHHHRSGLRKVKLSIFSLVLCRKTLNLNRRNS